MPRFRYALFAILGLLLGACAGVSRAGSPDPRIDAFFRDSFAVLHREVDVPGASHFAVRYDTTAGLSEAIGFMQTITDIPAPLQNPGQYAGIPTPTPFVVRCWEQWYLDHRRALRWDEQTKQPVRDQMTYK